MKLSEENLQTLMLSIHRSIEQNAELISDRVAESSFGDLCIYPPNGGFTRDEEQALMKCQNDDDLRSALRKILANNAASVIFELFNYIDGTGDPSDSLGEWTGAALVDADDEVEEPDEMLHDRFYGTYLEWREMRPEKGWTLDLLEW